MVEDGCRIIMIDTQADNVPARKFFERAGFGSLESHVYFRYVRGPVLFCCSYGRIGSTHDYSTLSSSSLSSFFVTCSPPTHPPLPPSHSLFLYSKQLGPEDLIASEERVFRQASLTILESSSSSSSTSTTALATAKAALKLGGGGGGGVGGGFGLLLKGGVFEHVEAEGGTGDEDVRAGGEALEEGEGVQGEGVVTGGGGQFDHADEDLSEREDELAELLLLLVRGGGREGGIGG